MVGEGGREAEPHAMCQEAGTERILTRGRLTKALCGAQSDSNNKKVGTDVRGTVHVELPRFGTHGEGLRMI